jgi:hypothetical protein
VDEGRKGSEAFITNTKEGSDEKLEQKHTNAVLDKET